MPAPLMETIVDRLASASIAIALMVAAAWLACRLRPSLAPSTRSTIWWLVAVAALLRLAPLPALTVEVPDAWRLGGLLPAAPAPMSVAAPGTAVAPTAVDALSRVPTRVAARVPARVAERLTNPFVPLAGATDRHGRRSGVAVRLAHAAGSRSGPSSPCALFARLAIANWRLRRLADDAEPVPDAIGAEVDRLAARPGSAPHAGRPRLRRHRDATGVRPAASHRAAAGRRVDGADPARAGDDAVSRTGARPAPGSRLRLGARRHGAPAVLPPRSPAGGARICVRARSRLRRRRAAAPRRSPTRLRSAPPPPRGHPAARRARRGAVVALDANAPKETRDAERSRTVAARRPRASGWPARCCCRSPFRSRSWPASRTSRLRRRRRRRPRPHRHAGPASPACPVRPARGATGAAGTARTRTARGIVRRRR